MYRWLVSQAHEFHQYDTVYIVADNRDLVAAPLSNQPGLAHWPAVATWWKERIKYSGPYAERTTVVFVPISGDTGLDRVHPTWAGTYILDACVYLFPAINFALIDSDCVPVTLFEIQELWLSCNCKASHPEEADETDMHPTSPIAPAHKRASLWIQGERLNNMALQRSCRNLTVLKISQLRRDQRRFQARQITRQKKSTTEVLRTPAKALLHLQHQKTRSRGARSLREGTVPK